MATLTRPRTLDADVSDASHALSRGVPKPFPTLAEREQEELLESLSSEQLRLDIDSALPEPLAATPAYTEASREGSSEQRSVSIVRYYYVTQYSFACRTNFRHRLTTSVHYVSRH